MGILLDGLEWYLAFDHVYERFGIIRLTLCTSMTISETPLPVLSGRSGTQVAVVKI